MEPNAWFRTLAVRDPRRRTLHLSTPWGARIPGSGGHPGIYLIASGTAVLSVDRNAATLLETGDVAVLPQGQTHVIASGPDASTPPVEEFYAMAPEVSEDHVVGGGGGAQTHLLTLCFSTTGSTARAITSFAPSVVVLRAGKVRTWLSHIIRATLEFVDRTVDVPEPVAIRLGELLLFEALSGNILEAGEVDPPVLRAAMLMRSDLTAKWTVAALARKVGLSRSAFFERFVHTFGCPPNTYLFRARMEEAAVLLTDGVSISEVSASVGYDWPSSFTTAFRRFHGVAPSTHKKTRRSVS